MTDRNNYRTVNNDEKHRGEATKTTDDGYNNNSNICPPGRAAEDETMVASHRDKAVAIVMTVSAAASEPTESDYSFFLYYPTTRAHVRAIEYTFIMRT